MIIKNKWVVSIGLTILGAIAMFTGNTLIATAAVAFLGGWLAGEKNGEADF